MPVGLCRWSEVQTFSSGRCGFTSGGPAASSLLHGRFSLGPVCGLGEASAPVNKWAASAPAVPQGREGPSWPLCASPGEDCSPRGAHQQDGVCVLCCLFSKHRRASFCARNYCCPWIEGREPARPASDPPRDDLLRVERDANPNSGRGSAAVWPVEKSQGVELRREGEGRDSVCFREDNRKGLRRSLNQTEPAWCGEEGGHSRC